MKHSTSKSVKAVISAALLLSAVLFHVRSAKGLPCNVVDGVVCPLDPSSPPPCTEDCCPAGGPPGRPGGPPGAPGGPPGGPPSPPAGPSNGKGGGGGNGGNCCGGGLIMGMAN